MEDFREAYNKYTDKIDRYELSYSFVKKQNALDFVQYLLDNKYIRYDVSLSYKQFYYIDKFSQGVYDVEFFIDVYKGYDILSFMDIISTEFLSKLQNIKGGVFVGHSKLIPPTKLLSDEEIELNRIDSEKRFKSKEYKDYAKKHFSPRGLKRFKKALYDAYKERDKVFNINKKNILGDIKF